jgi:hypothetical protein
MFFYFGNVEKVVLTYILQDFGPQIRKPAMSAEFSPNIQFKENGQTSTMILCIEAKTSSSITNLKGQANKTALTIFL